MWHYLHSKKSVSVSEKLIILILVELLTGNVGDRNRRLIKRLVDRLEAYRIKVYYTDNFAGFREVIPAHKLV